MKIKINKLIVIVFLILFMTTTIAYSGLSTKLAITSEAMFRPNTDIRVTKIKLESSEGNALENYSPKYNVNTTTTGFTLPDINSSITYRVTVTNYGDINQTIYSFIEKSVNIEGIKTEIIGYTEKEIIGFDSEVEFLIKFTTTNPSEEIINYIEEYEFRKVYEVEYDANKGENAPKKQIKYEKEDLKITEEEPERIGYEFKGWSISETSTSVEYKKGSTYTVDKDIVLYAVWEKRTYKIKLENIDDEYVTSEEEKKGLKMYMNYIK